MSAVIERAVQLKNKYGLHARPATMFAERANEFQSEIVVVKDGQEVNGKSIFGIMMLGAEQGSTLVIRATGQDASSAVEVLSQLVDSKFFEE